MIPWFRRLAEARYRIATQLYVGIGGAAALTLAASLVALFAFAQVGDSQNRVTLGTVPELAAAFGVAQGSGTLVAAGPRLTATANQDELNRAVVEIAPAQRAFESALEDLMSRGTASEESFGGDTEIVSIRTRGGELIGNIAAIEESVSEGFQLGAESEELRLELESLHSRIEVLLVPALDDQLFYAMTGFRSFEQPPVPRDRHFSEPEIDRYRVLVGLQQDVTIIDQLLKSLAVLTDRPLIEPVEERYESSATSIERALSAVDETATSDRLKALFVEMLAKSRSAFDLRRQEVDALNRQQALLEENQNLAVDVGDDVERLVAASQARTDAATEAASQAISTGRALLLGLNILSIAGAVFIGWLFVGRLLVRRFEALSSSMREMAGGNLEAEIGIGGKDEVADMAAALEVFRRHALEVQRLNLVEKLAAELRGKNKQLETALEDLRRAQNQIVAREKLAGLGELTAGVAHEIRNPLNFVFNFSEASGELLDELNEELETDKNAFNDTQKQLLKGICLELDDCLKRIRSHGGRAARILTDMLKMGSSTGERQTTDINGLLREQVRIALDTIRAADAGTPLDIAHDLDPDAGQIEVVPRDMGRVFHNLIINAWHATEERRRSEDPSDMAYKPTVAVSSRRFGDCLQVRVRDNGTGIPDEVVDNIFNPFFTTKPTDQGTGLGLSLCNDILRGHGGEIRVETEWGSHTEMIVELPVSNVPSES